MIQWCTYRSERETPVNSAEAQRIAYALSKKDRMKERLAVLEEKRKGLLCSHCNFGIGFLGDNVDILLAAIGYLNHWK
jgi:hypothetical protein